MISAIYNLKKDTLTTYKTIKVGHASNSLLDESKKKGKSNGYEQWKTNNEYKKEIRSWQHQFFIYRNKNKSDS